MKTRFAYLQEQLRGSFWFVPSLMAGGAMLLSFLMLALDHALQQSAITGISWAYVGSPEGARALLSTVAGSVITVAGVSFSITIAALTLASSQFGPRLLRNFLRDTGNQVVLGTFIATFLYCLLILRTIHGFNDDIFVPNLSVTVGVALAVASIVVLIYFVHHASVSIQADHIIATVGVDLEESIEQIFPERLGRPAKEALGRDGGAHLPPLGMPGEAILSRGHGYVQAIDTDGLMRLAVEHDTVIHLLRRPGQFVTRGAALADVWPRERAQKKLAEQIEQVFLLGTQRTMTQDVLFAVDQLVEIAVRALSPAINDPFTAISCIDQLGAALCQLAQRAAPIARHYDAAGHLRVIVDPVSFTDVLDTAFGQIRQYGRTSTAVTNHLLETIAVISQLACSEEQRAALLRQAEMIARGSQEGLPEPLERQAVALRFQRVVQALECAKKVRLERVAP